LTRITGDDIAHEPRDLESRADATPLLPEA
jgi:hypothetical protein